MAINLPFATISIFSLLFLFHFCLHLTASAAAEEQSTNTSRDSDSVIDLVGAFVLPHGGIALTPDHFNMSDKRRIAEAHKIQNAALEVAKIIREQLKPDLILLSTPHGVADLQRFIFYLNTNGNGSADTDNCQCPECCHSISVKMDVKLALKLVERLQKRGLNVSALSFMGPPDETNESPATLGWGEVIPLLLINDQINHRTNRASRLVSSNTKQADVVILSQPLRRYDRPREMIPELLSLGEELYKALEQRENRTISSASRQTKRRAILVISADLAHTHERWGPYGWSPAAAPFDKACAQWASTLDGELLTKIAAQYVNDAKSCGFTGFVMLHGLIEATGGRKQWTSSMLASAHPSYYGMMVASFLRERMRSDN